MLTELELPLPMFLLLTVPLLLIVGGAIVGGYRGVFGRNRSRER